MARSAEALQRRALRRNRTVQEQELVDAPSNKKIKKKKPKAETSQKKLNEKNDKHDRKKEMIEIETKEKKTPENMEATKENPSNSDTRDVDNPEIDPLQEPGAWTCPSCQNRNFASRRYCYSIHCNERRPSHIPLPPRNMEQQKRQRASHGKHETSNKKPRRHDPATSKPTTWNQPSPTPRQLEYNQQLRQRYREEDPTLLGDDLERAKILIARDERKKQKQKSKKTPLMMKSNTANESNSPGDEEIDRQQKTKQNETPTSIQQKLQNKQLLELFERTRGKGMAEADLERAQQLLARKQRKRAKRHNQQGKSNVKEEGAVEKRPSETRAQSSKENKNSLKQDKKKARKQLLKLYRKSNGSGMSAEDVQQAKELLAKKEEKRARRRSLEENGQGNVKSLKQ